MRIPGSSGRLWITIGVGLALACGCGGKKERGTASLPPLQVQVDASLLGPAVTDSSLGVTFRPPALFQPVPEPRLLAIQEAVRSSLSPNDSIAAVPERIYGRPGSVALCTVSRFVHPPARGANTAWMDACAAAVRRTVAPASIQEARFRMGNAVGLRFVVQNSQMVLTRLVYLSPAALAGGGAPVQIDYLFPRAEYPQTERAIESSTGTVGPAGR